MHNLKQEKKRMKTTYSMSDTTFEKNPLWHKFSELYLDVSDQKDLEGRIYHLS